MGRTIDLTKGKIEVMQGTLSDETRALLEGAAPKEVVQPECLRCGVCCRWTFIEMPGAMMDVETCKALERKGHKVKLVKGRTFLCVYGRCKYLFSAYNETNRIGEMKCSIQGDKPACCKSYHCSFDPIMKALKLDKDMVL